jgi:hypothetical protein
MCDICASKLVDDINRKINWQPGRLVKWASRRGLHINRDQLQEHFTKHLNGSNGSQDAGIAARNDLKKPGFKATEPSPPPLKLPADDRFLNEVVSQVFGGLISGAYELKLEHGFKAIELKQKISENINAEKLLLDLLNHIRSEELGKTDPT